MRSLPYRTLTGFLLLTVIVGLEGQNADEISLAEDFRLHGIAIWQCQCPAYACPCQKNGLPTHGMCHASDFAHIKRGHYGKVSLDDLNVVLVGNLVDGTPERLFATLYVDSKATAEQSDALTRIVRYLNAEANQPPVPLRKIKVVPIVFRESVDHTEYSVDIPEIVGEKALLKRHQSGSPLHTMPAMDLWSNSVHNADNVEFKYHDAEVGESWDFSGHYTNVKFFDLSRAMYAEQRMLGQHGDNSGKWTPKQLEIIKQERLKEN